MPVTRVQSADGRWAYTLYAGADAFIHALDTVRRTAVCIDLPKAIANNASMGRLALSGGTLQVSENGQPAAVVDLRTFKVGAPQTAARPRPRATPRATPQPASGDGGPPLALWALPLAAFGARALLARRRVSSSRTWSRSSRA
jgi:hypothetical protein